MSHDDPAAAPSLTPGSTVDEFVIDDLLGRGGMGEVYRAFDRKLERTVAMKLIAVEAARDPSFVARFWHEAKLASTVVHPNVAQVFAAGTHGERPYYVMEYVEGESLADHLESHGRMTGSRVLDYLAQACRGLAAAREAGIVHRDVKPSNLLLTPSGTLKIVDFGLARSVSVDRSLVTEPGLILGTPTYTAPEQALGLAIDHRADIYSLGASFFHLLSGEPVFSGESALGVLAQHVESPPRSLETTNPRVPPAVAALVDRMLEKRPEDRPQSYDAILEELERARSKPLTPPPAAAGSWLRSPLVWGIALLATVVVLAARLGDPSREASGAAPSRAAAPPPVTPRADHEQVARRTVALDPAPDPVASPAAETADPTREIREQLRSHPLVTMAWNAQTLSSMRRLATVVEMHRAEEGVLSDSLEELAERYGLRERELVDSWGSPIRLVVAQDSYELHSSGADRRDATADDLVLEDGFVVQGAIEPP